MTIQDKVAMYLTKYGYSLIDGIDLYFRVHKGEEIIIINKEKDFVLWMSEDCQGDGFYFTAWKGYRKQFCWNNDFIADLCLDNLNEGGLPCIADVNENNYKEELMQFFKEVKDKCWQTSSELPDFPESCKWIFGDVGMFDYFEPYENFPINEDTVIEVSAEN